MNLHLLKVTPPHKSNVCGVVITHNPGETLVDNVQLLSAQVPFLILVDNGSKDEALRRIESLLTERVEILRNLSNLGIAVALNQGLQRAKALGYSWALTLDQDSRSALDLVEQLCAAYSRAAHPEQICIVAPQIINLDLDKQTYYLQPHFGPLYKREYCHGKDLDSVTTVITSGSLINLDAFERVGDFRKDFFIDYVDTEFCLRARSMGYRIIVACNARIDHVLGRRRQAKVGEITLYPTFHLPLRWYYISRNRIAMIRMYATRFPHWFSYEIVASLYTLVRMLLTEDQRLEKLRAIWQGMWDGLRGRMGERP